VAPDQLSTVLSALADPTRRAILARLASSGVTVTELAIARVFDAPRALVFRAWTEPVRAAQWWGPRGFITLACELEVRPGGTYRRCMRSPEGTVHCSRGVYREVVAPERLAFTSAWEEADGRLGRETLVTVTFAEHGRQTRLTLHQAGFDSVEARNEHQVGWTSCLERFADYLQATQAA
jgi:uncharacterized protein YndB with AHSA1/START domain